MVDIQLGTKAHPAETDLSDYLSNILTYDDKVRIESHIASCSECLAIIVSAYDSVKIFDEEGRAKRRRVDFIKKFDFYLVLAVLSFALSFALPGYFIQFLVATLLLGIKWVVDAKSTRMLVMIHEAWKSGREKEVPKLFCPFDLKDENKSRL